MNKMTIIFQVGHRDTGTTLLTNLLYGFISPREKVRFYDIKSNSALPIYNHVNIFKSHHTNLHEIIARYGKKYNLYFVCTERDYKKINNRYKALPNVVIVDYNEILETATNTIENITNVVYDKLIKVLPPSIRLNKETATERIKKMNKLYEIIKSKSFDYTDPFYHLHGHHRNRSNQNLAQNNEPVKIQQIHVLNYQYRKKINKMSIHNIIKINQSHYENSVKEIKKIK
jgi:hypothetical protein